MSTEACLPEMKNLEPKIKNRLAEQGMTIQRLATESGISEPTIHAIFNRGDAKLSQLEKIAEALSLPLSFLLSDDTQHSIVQTGDFNQAGNTNTQKIKGNKNNVIGTNHGNFTQVTGKRSLTDHERQLDSLQRENELLKSQLQDKERTIQILLKQVP